MSFKVIAGLMAALMMIAFVGSIVIKLKEVSLAVVVLIGVGMMVYELYENVRSRDD